MRCCLGAPVSSTCTRRPPEGSLMMGTRGDRLDLRAGRGGAGHMDGHVVGRLHRHVRCSVRRTAWGAARHPRCGQETWPVIECSVWY